MCARSSLFFKCGKNKQRLAQKLISFAPQHRVSVLFLVPSIYVLISFSIRLAFIHRVFLLLSLSHRILLARFLSCILFSIFFARSTVVVAAVAASTIARGPTHLSRRIQINKSLKTVLCIRILYTFKHQSIAYMDAAPR